jgi:uncharacterized membrane protein YdjX (TVP38/TMEM64 family)
MESTGKKILAWTSLFATFGLSFLLMDYLAHHALVVEDFITSMGALGPLVSVMLYGALGASPIPSEPLTMINGAVYGPLMGTIIAGTGNTVAAVVEYYIGQGIGNAADFEEKRKDLPFGLGRFPVDSVWFLLGARMIPGYAPKLVSVAGGIYRVPMLRYIWTTAIPAFIGAAIFAYGGYGLIKLF